MTDNSTEIINYLRSSGISSVIDTNGYLYRFDHNNLHIQFCVQYNYQGSGRFVGSMYFANLNKNKKKKMNLFFENEDFQFKSNSEKWAKNVRKYNYRQFCFGSCLDDIIPQLIKLIETPVENYISSKIASYTQRRRIIREYVASKVI